MIKDQKVHIYGFLLLVLTLLPANAQWEKTSAIVGGVIVSIAVSDSIILAGTQQGCIYHSSDNGNTWSQIMSLDYRSLGHPGALAINENGIYALYGGLYPQFSEDGGTSWFQINSDFPHQYITTSAICGTTLFAVNESYEVYQSTDNGNSWSDIAFDLSEAWVHNIAVCDSIIIICVDNFDGIISTDYGKTWRTLNSGLNDIAILSIAESNGTLFAAALNGIVKSTDNGETWTFDSMAIAPVNGLAVKDGMLFAGTRNGVYRSTDNGETWDAVNSGFNNLYITAIAVKGDALFAGSNGDGVFRSADNGETWVPVNVGIKNEYFVCLAAQGNTIVAGMRFGGIAYSSDNGETWKTGNPGSAFFNDIRCLAANKSTIFAGTGYNGIFRSDDNGTTWSGANAGIDDSYNGTDWMGTDIHTIAANDSSIVVSSIYDGIFRSTDNGMNWIHADSGFYFTSFFSTPSEDGPVFIGCDGGTVCRISTDHGRSWFTSNPVPPEAGRIWSVAAGKHVIYAGTDSGIVFSSDTGTTWTEINTGLPQTKVWHLAVSGSTLFAGTDSGCFVLNEGAARRVGMNSNLPSGASGDLAVTDCMLFAVTNEGIWRFPLTEIAGINDRQSRRTGQRHAFPGINVSYHSDKRTAISFSLEQPDYLTLSIYNLQGRLMAMPVDEYLGPGIHNYFWNHGTVGFGNYYIQIRVGGNRFVKCITVLH